MFATLFVRAGDVALFGGESRGGRVGGGVGLCCERAGGGEASEDKLRILFVEKEMSGDRVFSGEYLQRFVAAEPIAGECHRGSAGRNGTKYGG